MSEGGVSGLVDGATAAALHHEHQGRDGAAPGTQYSTQLPFVAPAFGQVNTIYLPPMPMVMKDAWIELEVAAIAGPTTPAFAPCQTWIQNINLLYRRNTVYSMSEPECLAESYYNSKNSQDLNKRLDLMNDVAVVTRRLRCLASSNTTYTYMIPLRRLVDAILSKAGPMNAYSAQSWSIDVNLLALNQIAGGASTTAATGGAISSAKLVMVGHKEDPANTTRIQNALKSENGGIAIKFEQSQYRRFSYAASAAGATISMPELQGEMTSFMIMQRTVAGVDGVTPSTVNHLAFQVFDNVGDTLAIGTQADPQALFGQAMPQRVLRSAASDSFAGCSDFLAQDPVGTVANAIAQRHNGILWYSLEDAATLGQREGVFSGVLRIQNDFQIVFAFASTTTANYVDVVVYLRRNIVLTESGFGVINEE